MPNKTQSPPNAPAPPTETFEAFVTTVAKLRAPDGCPWDREQTHRSLVPYLIEESFELAEAIESGQTPHIVEELGDVLLQVVLHAQIASENEAPDRRFTINDVADGINRKMIRRHPHVFGDAASGRTAADFSGISSDQVLKNWSAIKATEKATEKKAEMKPDTESETGANQSQFRFDIPVALPALQRSAKIGEKTKKLRFDWPDWRGVLAKVDEELTELKSELNQANTSVHRPTDDTSVGASKDPIAMEIGDLLFTIAQLARHRGLDPEQCLRDTNARFERRFSVLSRLAKDLEKTDGRSWEIRAQSELEELWQKAKAELRSKGED